jgi:mono/diheme cytochrome c family protein
MKRSSSLLGIFATASVVALGSAIAQTPPSASVWDGVYTEEQVSRGEALYQKECLSCHGPTLEGGEMAPGLADGAFKANWNGLTMGDLYDRIHESMPPDDPGRLSRQETADVLSRVLSANGFPSGEKELPGRPEMLRLILFDPFH